MSEIDHVSIGEPLPQIAEVVALDRFCVEVVWSLSGTRNIVDLAPDIFTFKTYARLRDRPDLFKTVHVIEDGSALAWGADDSIDMPATAVDRLASDVMSTFDFQAFLQNNNLSWEGAAAQLGISRRLVGYYAKGQAIPRYIALACTQLSARRSAAA